MSKAQLLEDIFEVSEKDPDGKKFDKVSRIKARSDLYEMDLTLDVNVDVYPVEVGDKLVICLASTLNLDGTPSASTFDASFLSGKRTLMDNFDYVMHGKVFKFKDSSHSGQLKADVYVSYGGLLMQLTGDPKRLEDLDIDQNIYLLMRKVA
ncbi:DNA-directed RNA polymerases II and V subunit 8A-like [Micractinium conductrix]|uniref:DNA-directed RNA polymerases II and V subunit 8A-like n=1 Tax=Micractinium conductrix TaxID=554055 RepID=A0A2P6VPV8_9CHLO|nr:DNA-directed RNA polymerases II and V subunit 8A-like [Micractinium conductrix]|eukprot:PSC76122.1 DNA-directed RNA polymerases II and V subunit 8A-like [Micractinium conductrix]